MLLRNEAKGLTGQIPALFNGNRKLLWRFMRSPDLAARLVMMQGNRWLSQMQPARRRLGLGGRINQVSLRLTDRCGMRCLSCGQWGPHGFLRGAGQEQLAAREQPPAVFEQALEDLVDAGHKPLVYLWGGEPLLYPGFGDVIKAAGRLGLYASLATNGVHLEETAEELAYPPVFLVQASVDGPDAVTHNAARPMAGGGDGFSALMNGLRAVRRMRAEKRAPLPLLASLTTITKKNQHSLLGIFNAMSGLVDMMVFYLSWWIDPVHSQKHERDFNSRFGFEPRLHRGWEGDFKPDDMEALSRQLATLQTLSMGRNAPPVVILPHLTSPSDLEAYYKNHDELFGFKRCMSIFHQVEIGSGGGVSPCRDYHDYPIGNISQKSIVELWNSRRYTSFRQSLDQRGLMPACCRCCGLMGY